MDVACSQLTRVVFKYLLKIQIKEVEMDIQEYKRNSLKSRTLHVELPSGLELDLRLPSPAQILFNLSDIDSEDDRTNIKKVLSMIQFPNDLTLDDFTAEDLMALIQYVADFLNKVLEPLNNSNSM